jgi:Tfp pilus assembly protein PilV
MRLPGRPIADQSGSALLEVLVSGILLVIVAGGVFEALDSAARSTGEERHRARANAIAQEDLARMRAMRISDLSNLNQTRTVNEDNTPYSVNSKAQFLTDATGTASCEAGVASADYIKIVSTVTWPSIGSRPPVTAASIVAPPNGSVSADSGALAIGVEDSQNQGIEGIGLSGSGPGSFSGTTGPNGCAIFGDLPAGSYTVTVSGVGSGLVDRDGNAPGPIDTSVVGESTNTLVLQYDSPGSIPVTFTTLSGGVQVNATTDSVMVFNTGMTVARSFGTAGTPATSIAADPLFPFTSPYAVYAGTCEADNPNPDDDPSAPGAPAAASVLVPPGGNVPATIQLPALDLTVYSGSTTGSSKVAGATVRITDMLCQNAPTTGFRRTFTTDSQGKLADLGLPYSNFQICASAVVGGSTWRNYVRTGSGIENVPVQDLTASTSRGIFLQGTGSQTGECP